MVYEETESDGYVYYLNFDVGFTSVCADERVCQNIKLYTLNMCSILHINYTSIINQDQFL